MLKFNRPIELNGDLLNQELAAAGLPLQGEGELWVHGQTLIVNVLDESHRNVAQNVINKHSPLPPLPDHNQELEIAIQSATTLEELKDALLGNLGRGKISGRPTE